MLDLIIKNGACYIDNNLKDVDTVRESKQTLIKMSETSEKKHNDLKRILRKELYEHEQVRHMTLRAKKVIKTLFDAYIKNPEYLTNEIQMHILTLIFHFPFQILKTLSPKTN